MKYSKEFVALLLGGAMLGTTYASAESIAYYAKDAKVKWTIEGNDGTALALATRDGETTPVYVKTLFGDNGVYTDTFRLPSSAKSGGYTLSVVIDGAETRIPFRHINPEQAKEEVAAVGKAGSDLGNVIESNYSDLGIDLGEFIENKDAIIKYFAILKTTNMTYSEFWDSYNASVLLASLCDEADDTIIEDTLIKNGEMIGLDSNAFSGYSEKVKKEIIERFRKGEVSSKPFGETVAEWTALARLNNEESLIGYRELLLTEYKDVFKPDMSDYNSSKDKDTIIRNVMKATYNTADEVVKAFEAASEKYQGSSDKQTGAGGGGGSSSGGSSSGGVSIPAAVAVQAVGLSDVDGHWAGSMIDTLYKNGIVSGSDGRFNPDANITRAEFCTMLAKAFYKGQIGDANKFTDVSAEKWYFPFVSLLAQKGVINGKGDGIFAPDEMISRQDMCAIISGCMKDLNKNMAVERDITEFADTDEIASYSSEAVNALYQAGIVSGNPDGTFRPRASLTRAEAATVIYKILNKEVAR